MKEFEGKKLLILGGASQHCKVVEAAHDLGVLVYVADYLKDSPAKLIADYNFLIDVKAVDELALLCKKENIDGVIATSLDACVLPYYKLCKKMGYPCFGDGKQYEILTNKQLFKECCKKYGIDTIPSYTIDEIFNQNNVEYPIFIKPVDSRGSRGQSICFNREEAIIAIEKARQESASENILIEKYMEDYPDFTAGYLVLNGEPILVRTGDRFEGPKGSGIENLCIASCSPSKYTEIYLKNTNKKVVEMLKGMKLKNAPVFFQGFIDKNTIRFYDPGLRFAGGEYETLLYHATNINIIEILVRYALGGDISHIKLDNSICLLNGKYSVQLDPTLSPGIISSIQGIEEIKKNSSVLTISQRYEVGDQVVCSNDLRQRFAEFGILSESIQQEVENICFVQNTLKILDQKGNSMIVFPFDTEKISISF